MPPWPDGTPIVAGIFERINVQRLRLLPQKAWDAAGYQVPTTFDQLQTLMDQMVKDGTTPWCIGIESGSATGWVATDWIENIMLRTTTPENYDAWVAGKLKFSSPEVTNAANIMAKIWSNPKYVYGGSAYVVKTSFGDSTKPMFDPTGPKWMMNMNGNFISSFFPATAVPGVDYRRSTSRPLIQPMVHPWKVEATSGVQPATYRGDGCHAILHVRRASQGLDENWWSICSPKGCRSDLVWQSC